MKYIPFSVVCPMASCTRSNTCARYAHYVKSLADDDILEVFNVKRMNLEGDACPYHLVVDKQRWARGFRRICNSIPSGHAHYLYNSTPYTQRRFYKAKNGEFLIEPKMQQRLLAIFQRLGADVSIGFDSYEDVERLVEK